MTEIVRGQMKRAQRGDERFAAATDWFAQLLAGPEVEVLSFDGDAAQVAGDVLALLPLPPTARARGENKAARRARWLVDVQIAATAWVAGHGVLTENVRDFEAIAAAISELYPGAPPLEVVEADV